MIMKYILVELRRKNKRALFKCLITDILPPTDVNITQPSFTHSVGGYSSFLALPLSDPSWVSRSFDAQLHLSSPDPEQIALLFFVGGRNGAGDRPGAPDTFSHGMGDNYLAVSYVKGHVLLTWDLGSGVYCALKFRVFINNCC